MKLTANDFDIANLEHQAERHHALSAVSDKAAGRTRLSSGR